MMSTPLIKTGLSALVLALALTSCKEGATQQPQALPVTLLQIKPENIPVSFEYVGQTAGYKEVEVRARVGGILQKRYYDEGQPVQAGAVLFQIDPAPYQAVVDQARAALALSQANLVQATQDFNRIAPLAKENAVSKKNLDDAAAAMQSAKANVAASKASLDQAQINLGYTKVTAPISGVTSKESVSEGSLIATSAEASLLTKISQLEPMYVNFSMSESESTKIKQMLAAKTLKMGKDQNTFEVALRLGDGTIYSEKGQVDFTDSMVDPSTGSIKMRAIFNNPSKDLLPGQFVRVILEGAERPNVIAIPQSAVLSSQQGKTVWVQGKDNKAEIRPVTLGQESGNNVIVESGLTAGDKVVIDNLVKVRPGALLDNQPNQNANKAPVHQTSEKK
ncbi:efflux RND transporter periplasmic adaptor subunit [Neisseria sp. Ec49-e6-T10]|uniref:efflux RND transporter periplasmic adaptor subunit n=1 Tax=Neisseria sp. Ec49-e6-T10 TaxID=3140744 RepID=UPI003EC0B9A1